MARCPNGHVFLSSIYIDVGPGPVAIATSGRGNVEVCPYCGANALIDDFYTALVTDVLGVVRRMTWAQAQQVRKVVQEAKAAPADAGEDLAAKISAVSPEMGAIVNRFGANKVSLGLATALIVLVLSKCQVSVNLDVDVNELVRELNSPRPAAAQQYAPRPDQHDI
jgi:hypothetical protein